MSRFRSNGPDFNSPGALMQRIRVPRGRPFKKLIFYEFGLIFSRAVCIRVGYKTVGIISLYYTGELLNRK